MTGNSILKKIYQTFKNILFSSGGGLLHASSPQEMLALYDNLLVSLEEKDIEGAKAAMDASLNIIRKSFGRVKKGE
jgi:DNA-binding FadR family transcriptional regulator